MPEIVALSGTANKKGQRLCQHIRHKDIVSRDRYTR